MMVGIKLRQELSEVMISQFEDNLKEIKTIISELLLKLN